MGSDSRPNGIVFVSYTSADFDRVKPLVDELSKRFNIFFDRKSLKAGEPWLQGLEEGMRRARWVVGVFTKNLDVNSFALSEMRRAESGKILLPIKLDAGAKIYLGFDRTQHLDLSDWRKGTKRLSELFSRIREMLKLPQRQDEPSSEAWSDIDSVVSNSSQAVESLRAIADQVATIGGVLANQGGPASEVNASLREIHATCSAALEAIDRFLKPAQQPDQSDLSAYFIVPDQLRDLVRDKSGHCTRILEYYYRVGGLRDWLLEHAKSEQLVRQSDDAFSRLSNADQDLFANIQKIGAMLDAEATSVRKLSLSGKESEARERLLKAQLKLVDYRRQLTKFIARFTEVKVGIGYTPDV